MRRAGIAVIQEVTATTAVWLKSHTPRLPESASQTPDETDEMRVACLLGAAYYFSNNANTIIRGTVVFSSQFN